MFTTINEYALFDSYHRVWVLSLRFDRRNGFPAPQSIYPSGIIVHTGKKESLRRKYNQVPTNNRNIRLNEFTAFFIPPPF